MRTIIAGSRMITDYDVLIRAMQRVNWQITAVLSGAADGADRLGERYARLMCIPLEQFPARWRDKDGEYNPKAGFERNAEMALAAEALVALWDGKSPGTYNMIAMARNRGLRVVVHIDRAVTSR